MTPLVSSKENHRCSPISKLPTIHLHHYLITPSFTPLIVQLLLINYLEMYPVSMEEVAPSRRIPPNDYASRGARQTDVITIRKEKLRGLLNNELKRRPVLYSKASGKLLIARHSNRPLLLLAGRDEVTDQSNSTSSEQTFDELSRFPSPFLPIVREISSPANFKSWNSSYRITILCRQNAVQNTIRRERRGIVVHNTFLYLKLIKWYCVPRMLFDPLVFSYRSFFGV